MNRRSFVQTLAGAGLLPLAGSSLAQPRPGRTRLYRMDYYTYHQGDQGGRLNTFFSSQAPLFAKNTRAFGAFTAVMTPRTQTLMVLSGFSDYADMTSATARIEGDAGYKKAFAELEAPADPPYDTMERVLIEAADYSPEITAPADKPKSPRYFEIRVYHAPTVRQLAKLNERFSSAEIAIFHRVGVHPIFYGNAISGPEMPNLTYIIPFATQADREKAWDAFNADPEWQKVRAESVARDGQIVNYNNITLWRATAYSPIQ